MRFYLFTIHFHAINPHSTVTPKQTAIICSCLSRSTSPILDSIMSYLFSYCYCTVLLLHSILRHVMIYLCISFLCLFCYWHFPFLSLNALAILARCRGIRQSLEQVRTLAQSSRKKSPLRLEFLHLI